MSVLRHIDGHIEERRAEAREHLAQHLEEAARRLRSSEEEPCGVAALILSHDGSRDFEVCSGGGVEALALSAAMEELARALAEGG